MEKGNFVTISDRESSLDAVLGKSSCEQSNEDELFAVEKSKTKESSSADCCQLTNFNIQRESSISQSHDCPECVNLSAHCVAKASELKKIDTNMNQSAFINERQCGNRCSSYQTFGSTYSPTPTQNNVVPSNSCRSKPCNKLRTCLEECSVNLEDHPTSSAKDNSKVDENDWSEEVVPSVVCQSPLAPEPKSGACCDWIRNTTKEDWLILFALFTVDFTSQMCLSVMAPFFPQEASSKGVSYSVSGWIFGVFSLVQVVSSPIFGKLIPIVGSRFLITAGQFFSSGCIILFGLLGYIEPEQSDIFVALCFLLRVALAIGCTAASTASFAVTALCFPDSISTVFGFLETATGMGMMLGPAIGGVLNEAGGFVLSFAVLGGIMLLTVPINLWCLPANDYVPPCSQPVSIRQLLHIPTIIVVNLGVIVAAFTWSILDPTLSVFLNQEFQLSSGMMGLLFLLMSCIYAASAPIWGRLADLLNDSLPMMVGGFALSGVGLMLLGPSPIFNIDSELWLVILSLIILGLSVSLALVPTFDKVLGTLEKAGYKDDFAVYSLVAGMWGACFAFGDFVGPTIGGWLLDSQGFGLTMTYTAAACALMVVVILGLTLYERKCQKKKTVMDDTTNSYLPGSNLSDTTPLLLHSDVFVNSMPGVLLQ